MANALFVLSEIKKRNKKKDILDNGAIYVQTCTNNNYFKIETFLADDPVSKIP
jgi:hypothetical protein